VREDQVAAGGDRVAVPGQRGRQLGAGRQEVQHRHHEHADRPVEVEQAGDGRVGQDPLRVEEVGLQDAALRVALQDVPAVYHGDRVDVDVHHPGGRVDPARDLVHGALGRDARPEIEELVDALGGHQPYRPA